MDHAMQIVKPRNPLAPYIGGKLKLAPEIIRIIEQTEHTTYAECFVGMGGVFLRRGYAPKAEVINDYSRDVSNFFRILQRHYVQFMDMLKWQITSRSEFERLIQTDPETLTDLERAARFLYLQRTAFGGKVSGRNFGVTATRPARFDITKLATALEDVHERLSSVVIECLDYKDFIKKYDHEGCLFYLDPPYFDCEDDYGKGMFEQSEFAVMAECLKAIEGRFIMSINDTPQIREIFKDFHFSEVGLKYSVGGGANQVAAKELIIMNYEPNALLL
ncbi:MAG: DNA adenine methylase [Alphaproteobacteria bacterium]|jgi:DNA adenine methylase|nr:DNA adenine methylase [Alphaproteobacteria bacterium]